MITGLLALTVLLPSMTQAEPPRHAEAVGEILRILDSVPLVAISDVHALAEEGEFYLRLIRHPAAPGRLNDVILELGNELYQGIADRYVSGGRVPGDSLRMIWQNTTQGPLLTAWAPMYRAVLHAVREVNAGQPRERRIRVLLGDPAVEWRSVTREELWRIHFRRGDRMRELAWDSVVARGRRGIIIAGGAHLMRESPRAVARSSGPETKWGDLSNRVFIIGVHSGFGGITARFEPVIAALPVGSLLRTRGTFLAELDVDQVDLGTPGTASEQAGSLDVPPGMVRVNAGLKLPDRMDGYLYLGPIRSWTHSRPDLGELRRDPGLVAELQRRSCMMMGRAVDTVRLFRTWDTVYFPGGARPSHVEFEPVEPPPKVPPPLPSNLPEPCSGLLRRATSR